MLIPPPPPPLSGDETCLKAWKRICSASRKEFQAIYDRLGVTINERGESFYNPRLKGIVEELKEQVGESVRAAVFPGSRAHPLVMTSTRQISIPGATRSRVATSCLSFGQGVAEDSDGAVCIFVEGIKVPLIIQKSDGGFG